MFQLRDHLALYGLVLSWVWVVAKSDGAIPPFWGGAWPYAVGVCSCAAQPTETFSNVVVEHQS